MQRLPNQPQESATMDTNTSRRETMFAVATTLIGIGLWAMLVAALALKVAQPTLA